MMTTQAILFNKHKWTNQKAQKWLQNNHYVPIKPSHTTPNYHRYRISNPDSTARYQTRTIGPGIKQVMMYRPLGRGVRPILNLRPHHFARGGSMYNFITSNHDLVNGIVGGIHALMSLAAIGGIGYAIKRGIDKSDQ